MLRAVQKDEHKSAFQRILLSPPELLHDSGNDEDDEDSLPSLSLNIPSFYSSSLMKQPLQTRRKSVPQRSPSVLASAGDTGVVFQLDLESHAFSPPAPRSILSVLRRKIVEQRQQRRPRLYTPQHRIVTQIQMPEPKSPAPPQPQQQQQRQGALASTALSLPQTQGRPAKIKGPCQACRESSDGCMRKAFNWPFPSSAVFNDKGRPYVYLCNKCGLRYNKSGGCVCRNCRWVLCKEEKRKALQHIAYMRRTTHDGRVGPNDDIVDFVCSPKYWACGQPWKAGWIPHGDFGDDMSVEEDDDDDDDNNSNSNNDRRPPPSAL